MSNLSGAAHQAVLLLSPLGSQQELCSCLTTPAKGSCVSLQGSRSLLQELRAQQELSLLPDISLRHSQAFASVPVMVSKFPTENTHTGTHTHAEMHKLLILAQNSSKTSTHNPWEFYRSQRWPSRVSLVRGFSVG